jgi:hypothetical protein
LEDEKIDITGDYVPTGTKANPPGEMTATANFSFDAKDIGAATIGLGMPSARVYTQGY